ncbi:MAG TPA: right-handed parallel beta-helix repeat-containing protein [Sunxiuqinia sp.]|nr:right-handed parallel beta-helix repeat-containing protein [Sunxiuqinia sp.]
MKTFLILVLTMVAFSSQAKTYYVATDGSNSNSGDLNAPFGTIPKAISLVQPGDKIYIRGGHYTINSTIYISTSGTKADTCFLKAYPGERPVLDFSGTDFGKRGISLKASYWYIYGLDVAKAGDNGLNISGGSNNTIERCSFYENQDTGVQIGGGAHDMTIINCDSYYNADPPDYGDADGFAPKLDVGTNIKFIGCRAWGNCDDGWDGYLRGSDNVTVILDHCWTWGNGYFKDGTDAGPKANGNGFKMGGGDNSNSANLKHNFYLNNCVSFDNKAKGFDQNNNAGTMQLLNCSGYNNLSANYRITRTLAAGQTLTVKNCVSYQGKVDLADFAIEATNSWMSPFSVSAADFVTMDTTGVSGPRKADGSLPDVNFFHLAKGSDLIDVGTNVGLAFLGTAPDLGAFEYDQTTGVADFQQKDLKAYFAGNELVINYQGKITHPVICKLYGLNGQVISQFNLKSVQSRFNYSNLNSGIYVLELSTDSGRLTRKVMK